MPDQMIKCEHGYVDCLPCQEEWQAKWQDIEITIKQHVALDQAIKNLAIILNATPPWVTPNTPIRASYNKLKDLSAASKEYSIINGHLPIL